MRPNRGRACAVAVTFFCLSGFSATAADPSCPNPAVPLSVLLMPPPKPDSPQTKAELQELQRLQESRTPEQIKHVRDDDHRTLERFLGGIGVKVENLSESARRFFDCIDASVRHSVHEAKNTFDRTRPYRLPHNNLQTLKKLSDRDSASYPSAHATYGADSRNGARGNDPGEKGRHLQTDPGLRLQPYRFGRPFPQRRLRRKCRRGGNCDIAPEQRIVPKRVQGRKGRVAQGCWPCGLATHARRGPVERLTSSQSAACYPASA